MREPTSARPARRERERRAPEVAGRAAELLHKLGASDGACAAQDASRYIERSESERTRVQPQDDG